MREVADVQPTWVCYSCGKKHGRNPQPKHASTWHEDQCGVCGRTMPCTEPRDFGYLREWRRAK